MQYLLLLLLGVIAILSVVFALQNATAIAVDLFFWQVKSSLALVLIVTLLVGVGIGLLAATSSLIAKSWQIAGQQKRIKQLEQDLQNRSLKTVTAAAKPAVPAGLLPEASEPKP